MKTAYTLTYDAMNRIATSHDMSGVRLTFTYDALSRRHTQTRYSDLAGNGDYETGAPALGADLRPRRHGRPQVSPHPARTGLCATAMT